MKLSQQESERFIDLHGQRADDALIELKLFLVNCQHNTRVTIVVGIRNGSIHNVPGIKYRVQHVLSSVPRLHWEVDCCNSGQLIKFISLTQLGTVIL